MEKDRKKTAKKFVVNQKVSRKLCREKEAK